MQMLIDSMWVDVLRRWHASTSSIRAAGELIDRVPAATDADVATAIAAARSRAPAHGRTARP